MEAANALATTVATLQAEQASTVRLAASLTVAEHLLPQWLSRMRATHPDQAVELQVENSDRVVDLVRAGRVELGFVEAPEPPAGLASAQVATDRLVVICAPDHPWARRRRPVTPAELGATPLVVRGGCRRPPNPRPAIRAARHRPGPPGGGDGLPHGHLPAVATGVAPGVVSVLAAAADVESGRLRCVEVVGLDLGRQFPRCVAVSGPSALPAVASRRVSRRPAGAQVQPGDQGRHRGMLVDRQTSIVIRS